MSIIDAQLMLSFLSTALIALGEPEPWNACLYNSESIVCRRIFQCSEGPCLTFKLEWKDGVSDIFTRYKKSNYRNISYYSDTRGGRWVLMSSGRSFGLKNLSNNNSIVFDMTLKDCRKSALSGFCE